MDVGYGTVPADIYLFKVSGDWNTRKMCKVCLKLAIKTLVWCHFCRSGVFTCELWTDFAHCSGVSIVKFEQLITDGISYNSSLT